MKQSDVSISEKVRGDPLPIKKLGAKAVFAPGFLPKFSLVGIYDSGISKGCQKAL